MKSIKIDDFCKKFSVPSTMVHSLIDKLCSLGYLKKIMTITLEIIVKVSSDSPLLKSDFILKEIVQ